ncbi:MAG: prolipoprotein diacylglyceryl transferase [Endozoicomonadaceae bacterium]|nr:prolipoprotein diacylglyceryl transferase [Endozoicomonadaceae bacterium]
MIQYPAIDPVAIVIGPIQIHWYGLMYLVGFSMAWWLGQRRCHQSGGLWPEKHLSDVIFFSALGVVLGGRFGYVLLYHFDYFLHDPLWLFKVWEGGMSFHGGLLGVLLAMYVQGKALNKSFFQMTDFIAPLVPFGLGVGRIGNFIGGELWGRVSDLPWAMVFPNAPGSLGRHPSQLYQFALEGVALFSILWWFSSKQRPRFAVSGLFLICYSVFRFVVEFAREPDGQIGFIAWEWLTMGQLLSIPMMLAGVLLIWLGYSRHPLVEGANSDDRQWLAMHSEAGR